MDIILNTTAGGLYPAAAQILARDSFTRADGAPGATETGGRTWEALENAAGIISSGQLGVNSPGGTNAAWGAVVVPLGTSSYIVECDLSVNYSSQASTNALFAARVTQDGTGVYVVTEATTGTYRLAQHTAGGGATLDVDTVLLPTVARSGDRVRIEVSGQTITLFVNGARVAVATHAASVNASRAGVAARGPQTYRAMLRFDNFLATTQGE